jgi:hypothetical protein
MQRDIFDTGCRGEWNGGGNDGVVVTNLLDQQDKLW